MLFEITYSRYSVRAGRCSEEITTQVPSEAPMRETQPGPRPPVQLIVALPWQPLSERGKDLMA